MLRASNTRNLSTTDWNAAALGVPPPNPEFPNGFFGCSFNNLTLFTGQVPALSISSGQMTSPARTYLPAKRTHGDHRGSRHITFSFPINLANHAASSPSVATDASSIYVAWSGGPRGGPRKVRRIHREYSSAVPMTTAQHFPPTVIQILLRRPRSRPAYPQIAVDSKGNVSVAWEQPTCRSCSQRH